MIKKQIPDQDAARTSPQKPLLPHELPSVLPSSTRPFSHYPISRIIQMNCCF